MDRRRLIFAVFALVGTLAAQFQPPHQRRTRPIPPAAAQPAPVVPQQEAPAPPPPPTPEQMPPTAPQVTYSSGQLSITARNSTLRDILAAVGAQTGARVDIPAGMGNERIVAQIGPGPARDVVASLLADSPLDYIILGSNTAPGAVASIMLTPTENAGTPPAGQAAQPAQPFRAAQPPPSEDENTEPEPEAEPQQPPQAQPQEPGMVVPGTVGQPPNMETQPQQNPPAPQVKTPEQLLQELQRMQQQQQQQQQQTPPVPHRPPQPQPQL